jgi:hypothetical protein
MMMRILKWLIIGAAVVCVFPASTARSGFTLTPAATAQGFGLTTFASGFPSNGIGPLGIAFTNAGNILVADFAAGTIASFAKDADGQTYASASHVSGSYSLTAAGLATGLGGTVYLASYNNQAVYALNNDGSLNHTVATNLGNLDGIATNPVTGQLYLSSTYGILVVDPSNGKVTALTTGFTGNTDGLAFSRDGKTLYAAVSDDSVQAIKLSNPTALVFNSAVPKADGIALGTGFLAGDLFVNTNSGNLYEINLTTRVQTLIATGGSRGDFIQVDPNDGSLLLTQTDSILRLSAPSSVGFVSIPEPSSLAMTLTSASMIMAYGWRLRKRVVWTTIGGPAKDRRQIPRMPLPG